MLSIRIVKVPISSPVVNPQYLLKKRAIYTPIIGSKIREIEFIDEATYKRTFIDIVMIAAMPRNVPPNRKDRNFTPDRSTPALYAIGWFAPIARMFCPNTVKLYTAQ